MPETSLSPLKYPELKADNWIRTGEIRAGSIFLPDEARNPLRQHPHHPLYLAGWALIGALLLGQTGTSLASGLTPAEVLRPLPEATAGDQRTAELNWPAAGWQRLLSARDGAEARRALEAIEAGGLARGVRSQQLPALALLRAREGSLPLSLEERIEWASRLGYDSATVQFAAARAAWSMGPIDAIVRYATAVSALTRDFAYVAGVLSRLTVLLALAFIFSFIAYSGAMLVKYGPALLHDLGHLLPLELPLGFRSALGIGLAGFPLLLGFGWVGTSAVWLFALWGSLVRRERAVAALFLLLMAAAQPIAGAVAALLPAPESQRSLAATLRVQAGIVLEADRASLAEDARATEDPFAYFSLGRAAWLAGAHEEGIAAMRKAVEKRPGWQPAMNNLAILLLEEGNSAEAEALLKEALSHSPQDARLLFNLSYLYRRDFRLREAEQAYRDARLNDAEAVDRFTRVTGAEGSFVVPAMLGYRDLWDKRLNADAGSALLARNLAAPYLGVIPLGAAGPAVLAGFLLAVAISRWRDGRGRSGRCAHCGAEICPPCYGNELKEGVCTPCHVIYIQAQPVEARARLGQDQQVMHYRAARRRRLLIAGSLLPGLGHILMEQTVLGTAFLFRACLSAYAPLALFLSGASRGLWTPPVGPALGGLMILLAVAGVVAAFVLGGRNLFAKVRPI